MSLRFAAVAILALACAIGACGAKRDVSFSVQLPDSIDAAWLELGVYPNACPPAQELLGGIPTEGIVTRVAFKKGDPTPPAIGTLKRGTYAFAVVARDAACTVVGTGCYATDVSNAKDITVKVSANAGGGACGAGEVCDAGMCVPGSDQSDPSIGAGCSLDLMGAGPLGDPLGFGGTLVSAPAIAATPKGFLIAYREFDPTLGVARLTMIPVDAAGGAGNAQAVTLPGRCGGSEESDATSLAFVAAGGMVALARAPCGGDGGIDLFEVDPDGNVTMSGYDAVGPLKLTLATSHALAPTSAKDGWLLAYTISGETHVATIQGLAVAGAAPAFGGAPPQSAGWVATSDRVIALLAQATGQAPPPPADAGDDGGSAEAGAVGDVLRVQLALASDGTGSLPMPIEVPGSFGALALEGTRAWVVSDSAAPGRPVGWRAFDLGQGAETASDSFAVQGLGKVQYADVALAKDRAVVAVEQPGSVTLAAFDHALSRPTPLRQVFLPDDPRVPSMSTVRDGRIAIAASDTRVAIVWATAKSLSTNDDVGGYAVFACATP